MLNVFVGYDPREAAAYHTFCQSVIEYASIPVNFVPLHRPMLNNFDGQRDGTNAFIFSRFLVPSLMGFDGLALFCDGDMVVRGDIAALFAEHQPGKAVSVVKHDYRTKYRRKYVGTPIENANVDYPRKNWSSVILWDCGHEQNKILTADFVASAPGSLLHRFDWLPDELIGELPECWNKLIREQVEEGGDMLRHYTLGIPGIEHYQFDGAEWHRHFLNAIRIEGNHPADTVKRALERT